MDNPFYMQVESIPGLMEEIYWEAESKSRQCISTPDIFDTKQIYLFGSGDSHNAATGASFAFNSIAKIRTQVLTSMEASRFTASFLQKPENRTLAIGISNSGEVARVVEAMAAFTKNGARTLALAGAPKSRMAKNANTVLEVKAPSFVSAPGVRGYAVAQFTLYLLAIRFAEVKGEITMDEAGALRKSIYAYRECLADALKNYASLINEFASKCAQCSRVELLGAGPSRAAADFGAAKVIEAAGFSAVSQDTEEFVHINFFSNNPGEIPAILIAPENSRYIKRAVELTKVLAHQQRPTLVITSGKEFEGVPSICLKGGLQEEFFALFASVIVAAVAASMPRQAGNEYFRAHAGLWSEEGLPDIFKSELVLD